VRWLSGIVLKKNKKILKENNGIRVCHKTTASLSGHDIIFLGASICGKRYEFTSPYHLAVLCPSKLLPLCVATDGCAVTWRACVLRLFSQKFLGEVIHIWYGSFEGVGRGALRGVESRLALVFVYLLVFLFSTWRMPKSTWAKVCNRVAFLSKNNVCYENEIFSKHFGHAFFHVKNNVPQLKRRGYFDRIILKNNAAL
jgi:hypothetical protein